MEGGRLGIGEHDGVDVTNPTSTEDKILKKYAEKLNNNNYHHS